MDLCASHLLTQMNYALSKSVFLVYQRHTRENWFFLSNIALNKEVVIKKTSGN